MKKLAFLVGAFLFLVIIGVAQATTYECDSCSSCTDAIQGASSEDTILLNTSIIDTSDELCFDCTGISNNITIDCQSNTIDGDSINSYFGIYVENEAIIENCIISDFTNSGIDVGEGNNAIIKDTVIQMPSGKGIWIEGNSIDNTTIENVTISGNGDVGIFFEGNVYNLPSTSNSRVTNTNISGFTIGIRIALGNNTLIENSNIADSQDAIKIQSSNYTTVANSIIKSADEFGIWIQSDASNNLFYNNFFNNTINFYNDTDIGINYWNISVIDSPNIVGGSQIGGNYWAYPNGTGYSETCSNENNDSFCDSPYVLLDDNNMDFLPLRIPLTWTCNSCASCTDAIAGASSGDTVMMNASITFGDDANCIDFAGKDNITFDCNDFSLTNNELGGTDGIINTGGDIIENSVIQNC
jgi:parallel beta-helix repeat protein